MKLLVPLAVGLAAFAQQANEARHLAISSPAGTVADLTADSMLREPSLIHLKGNVRIKLRWITGPAGKYVFVYADEADYHVDTGAVEPSGHVRINPVLNQ